MAWCGNHIHPVRPNIIVRSTSFLAHSMRLVKCRRNMPQESHWMLNMGVVWHGISQKTRNCPATLGRGNTRTRPKMNYVHFTPKRRGIAPKSDSQNPRILGALRAGLRPPCGAPPPVWGCASTFAPLTLGPQRSALWPKSSGTTTKKTNPPRSFAKPQESVNAIRLEKLNTGSVAAPESDTNNK